MSAELDKEFKQTAECFQTALLDMLENDYAATLSIVTGTFVSLTMEVLRRNGHESDGEIRIDGGENRDVTIHARKGVK